MTEIAEHVDGFVGITSTLHEESERLLAVAEACRTIADQLAEREAAVAERERRVSEQADDLERRRHELDRWKHELDELAARADQAQARIAEANEREAALKALAQGLLERYDQHG